MAATLAALQDSEVGFVTAVHEVPPVQVPAVVVQEQPVIASQAPLFSPFAQSAPSSVAEPVHDEVPA